MNQQRHCRRPSAALGPLLAGRFTLSIVCLFAVGFAMTRMATAQNDERMAGTPAAAAANAPSEAVAANPPPGSIGSATNVGGSAAVGTSQSTGPRQIVIGLPQTRVTTKGDVVVEPNLGVYEGGRWVGSGGLLQMPSRLTPRPTLSARSGLVSAAEETEGFPGGGVLPARAVTAEPLLPETIESTNTVAPIFDDVIEMEEEEIPLQRSWLGLTRALPCEPGGMGRERLAMAPFAIDVAQPFSNFRIRGQSFFNQAFPDRAGYFWAKFGGRGPKLPETKVDYSQLRFLNETGGKLFSMGTELPFSWIDPEQNRNHAGLGDLNLATKTVLVNGDQWQITNLFRTYFNTGAPSMGLGTGQIQLEPGFLLRYKWSDVTYFHGEIKYWIPLGTDTTFNGQVLDYGFGVSHLWWESDRVAVIPTFEIIGYSVLNGQMTTPSGVAVSTDSTHIFNVFPGVRIANDRGSDLGLFELGISGGWAISNDHFYDAMLRVDVRWSY